MKIITQRLLPGLAIVVLVAGCRGVQTAGEKDARRDLAAVTQTYRPASQQRSLPVLSAETSLSNFLAYALLNSPNVEVAYDDWAASVERITVDRSMPDPKLTFQAYIQNDLTSLMPGLMQDLPGPGKLNAAAEVATAESRSKYFAFESAVLQAAFDFKSAYYNLYFLDEQLRVSRRTLEVLTDLSSIAKTQNEVGKGTLQDIYRAQIERDQLAAAIANLEHSRHSLMAQYKGTLGLTHDQPDPPVPAVFESTKKIPDEDELLAMAFARNPKLKAAEAEVRQAQTSIVQARKSRVPDFTAGLQAEVYEPPFYWPQASMTLPVWRDKIGAQIAAAQAGRREAAAKLTSEQISLAVDFAMRAHDYDESTRNLSLFENQLIPKARQSFELARSGYLSGQVDFSNLMDAERAWLNFQFQIVEERKRREISLAALSLLIAGVPPPGAPVLVASPAISSSNPLRQP